MEKRKHSLVNVEDKKIIETYGIEHDLYDYEIINIYTNMAKNNPDIFKQEIEKYKQNKLKNKE